MRLITELKRRNVVRVGLGYLLISWILLQIADVAFGVLQLPEWSLTLVFVILGLGLIPVLIFSWIFELTPDGLKRDTGADSVEVHHVGRKKLDVANAIMLAVVLGLLAWQSFGPRDDASAGVHTPAANPEIAEEPKPEKPLGERNVVNSIAVLAFDNFGGEVENEHFADGLADTILHSLAQVDDLLVTARNSSFAYKGQNVDVRKVGEELAVAYVLEGSVQRQGGRIRVIAQLIDTSDARHLWSKTYDGEDADIFNLQDRIASDVAESLQVSLGEGTDDALETNNLLAFNLVQLAKSRIFEGEVQEKISDGEEPSELIGLLREALEVEPNYLEAWVTLAQIYDLAALHGPGIETYQANLAEFEKVTEAAEAIAPAHPETLHIRALYEWRRWNAEGALESARAALEQSPNMAGAWRTLGLATSRLGDIARAELYFHRARELDPANPYVYRQLSWSALQQGRLEEAQRWLEQAIDRGPSILVFRTDQIELQARAYGRQDQALRTALGVLEEFEEYHSLKRTIAMILLSLDAAVEAERWLDRAENDLDDPDSVAWPRVYVLMNTGREDEADALVGRIMEQAAIGDSGVYRYAEYSRVRLCLQERDFACIEDIMTRLYPAFTDSKLAISESGLDPNWAANTHVILALADKQMARERSASERCREVLTEIEESPQNRKNFFDANCHAILGHREALLESLQAYLDFSDEAWFAPWSGNPYWPESAFFEDYAEDPEFLALANQMEQRRSRQRDAALGYLAAFEQGESLQEVDP